MKTKIIDIVVTNVKIRFPTEQFGYIEADLKLETLQQVAGLAKLIREDKLEAKMLKEIDAAKDELPC